MEEITGELRIVGYVDDIEEALMSAENRELPENLINDMNAIHGDIVELGTLLSKQEHYDRLTDAVEDLIDELVSSVRGDDPGGAEKIVDKLQDNVGALKKYLTESS